MGGADEQQQKDENKYSSSITTFICPDCLKTFTRKNNRDYHKKFRCPLTRGLNDHLEKSERFKNANREQSDEEIELDEAQSTTYRCVSNRFIIVIIKNDQRCR